MNKLLAVVGLVALLGVMTFAIGAAQSAPSPAASSNVAQNSSTEPVASATPRPSTRGFEGLVRAVVTNDTPTRTVTVLTQRGLFSFLVTPQTQIRPAGAQIVVGARIEGVARWNTTANNWVAQLVHVKVNRPFEGIVTAVVNDDITKTVTINQRGQSFTFLVNPQTQILPAGAQIAVGAQIEGVAGWSAVANNWVARIVNVHLSRSFEGTITAIFTDTLTRTVTITNQRSQTFAFLVVTSTQILPPGAPIAVGMKAEVQARWDAAANNWVARRLEVQTRRSHEGTITAIFTDTLTRTVTITTRSGQPVTFLVTPQTQIRPPGAQLRIGLRVQVQVEWDVVLDKWKALRLIRH